MNRLRSIAILAVCSLAFAVSTIGRLSAQAPAASPAETAAPVVASTEAAPAEPRPSGPKVAVVQAVYDYGRAKMGETIKYAFELRNDGSAPLEIREVRSDCACAATSYDATIAPGAVGRVQVTLDTANIEGPVARTITVLTNDAATPSVALTIKADVEPVIAIRPGYVRYLYVQKEQPGRVVQTLWSGDGQDFKVLAVESPFPHLAASFHEAAPGERRPEVSGRQWIVETILSPDAPVGPLGDWVEITTDHPKQKLVRFAISGFVRPVLTVTPPNADLGKRSLQSPRVGSFKVQVFATEEIEVTKVESDIAGLDLKLTPTTPGRIYKIEVSVTPAMRKGDFSGTMRIHTASPKAPLLEVPISGTLE